MFAHPGKKLNFMGNELGQLREWDENRELDWDILSYPVHDAFNHFIRDLNKIYLSHPALSELDYDRKGFAWIDCKQEKKCVYVFERRSDKEKIFAIFNFSGEEQTFEYRITKSVSYQLLIASDMERYGGKQVYTTLETSFDSKKAVFNLSPFSGRYYLME